MNKAVFLDRDGVIISLVYDRNLSIVRTPLSAKEVTFEPSIVYILKIIQQLGYKIFVISNQPDIGLKRISKETFQTIQETIESYFVKNGVLFDGYYYCFHHQYAKLPHYKKTCNCRKPKPGLFLQAAKEHGIDLPNSWMIGDGINDVIAGHEAGCKTILIVNLLESGYLTLLEKHLQGIKPNYIVKSLNEIPPIV